MSLKAHLWRIRHFETQPSLQGTRSVQLSIWARAQAILRWLLSTDLESGSALLQFHTIAGLSY